MQRVLGLWRAGEERPRGLSVKAGARLLLQHTSELRFHPLPWFGGGTWCHCLSAPGMLTLEEPMLLILRN